MLLLCNQSEILQSNSILHDAETRGALAGRVVRGARECLSGCRAAGAGRCQPRLGSPARCCRPRRFPGFLPAPLPFIQVACADRQPNLAAGAGGQARRSMSPQCFLDALAAHNSPSPSTSRSPQSLTLSPCLLSARPHSRLVALQAGAMSIDWG